MAVYRDKKVPIPKEKGITINRGDDNRVLYVHSARYDNKLHYTLPKRSTIGYVCKDDVTSMHPTDKYKLLFPGKWEELFAEKPAPVIKKMGMYTIAQAVNQKTGLKDVMDRSFGIDTADKLMDYAMYSVLFHSDSTSQFETRMMNQILYSRKAYSDSEYSDLFENKLAKSNILEFRKAWALQCKEDGIDDVWLCIDGSNDNCMSRGVELAEKGHAKSGENVNIVSFTYAVTADGKPVTFDVYRGGLVDAKAMRQVIEFLKECGISIRGVILDRGYCNANAIRYLSDNRIAYVIMIKGNPKGLEGMIRKYGRKLRMNMEFLIEGTCLTGVQEKGRLFDDYAHEDYITLFYDYINADERVTSLLKKLYREMDRLKQLISKGTDPEVNKKFMKFINIEGDGDSRHAVINRSELQKAVDGKGLYGIACSEQMTPEEVYKHYASRDASETQYMFVKTQLGYGTVRVQYTQGVYSKFAVGFMAAIMRFEIEQAAKALNRSATEMINEMNLQEMVNMNGSYAYVHIENERQIKFLKKLESSRELFDEVVKDENNRLANVAPVPRHRKPGRKQEKTTESVPKKKPGPEKGTIRTEYNKDGSVRKKPGTKPGTKMGEFKKDGTPRKKPGPKPGSHRKKEQEE